MNFKQTISLLALCGAVACGGKPADSPPFQEPSSLAQTGDSLVPLGEEQALPTPVETPAEPPKPLPATQAPPRPPVVSGPPAPPPVSPPVVQETAPPVAAPLALEKGKLITTTLVDSVHSRYTKVGDLIKVRVTQDVGAASGAVVIPAGAIISLKVTEIGMADSRGEKGTLTLKATEVAFDGVSHSLDAEATSYEYEMRARGIQGGDVAKTGAGAAAGALIGRVAGGKKGTVTGALVGGVVGAAVASSTADRDIIVHAGQSMTLTLLSDFAK